MTESCSQMLERLGDNASKWAAEFNTTAQRLGYPEMDEGWLIGWFANAIEHSTSIRRNADPDLIRATEENARLREALAKARAWHESEDKALSKSGRADTNYYWLRGHPSRAGLTVESKAGPVWNGEVRVNWDWIEQPLKWAKPRKIFVAAHGDLFHEKMARSELATIFAVMVAAHHLRGHISQVLTKRAAHMREVLNDPEFWEQVNAEAEAHIIENTDALNRRKDDARATCGEYGAKNPPPGIWLGVTAEDQERADERIPDLLATPAAVRFVSVEPMLGEININPYLHDSDCVEAAMDCCICSEPREIHVDWVICGGESGPGARPMHPDWARDLRDQCAAAGVPFFMKQMHVGGKLVKDLEGFPEDLRTREFPNAR